MTILCTLIEGVFFIGKKVRYLREYNFRIEIGIFSWLGYWHWPFNEDGERRRQG